MTNSIKMIHIKGDETPDLLQKPGADLISYFNRSSIILVHSTHHFNVIFWYTI